MYAFSRSVASDSLWLHGQHLTRLLCPRTFPGKNTGVGYHFLLQETSDPGIEPPSPALAGGFFTSSATWEAPSYGLKTQIKRTKRNPVAELETDSKRVSLNMFSWNLFLKN